MNEVGGKIVAVISAVIGVAIIAVIVSQKANTANVITAAGTSFGNVLGAALSPITGQTGFNTNSTGNLSLPSL